MANENAMKWIALVVVAYLVFGGGLNGTNNGGSNTNNPGTVPGGCAYAPTVTFVAQDKWDSTVNVGVGHQYKKNGGPTQTYAGSAVEAKLGDKFDVMFGVGNSTMYRHLESFEVKTCGQNQFEYDEMVQNTTMTMDCKDENGDVVHTAGTNLQNNMTIGSGETATIQCRMKLDTAKKGLPMGGVLVVELKTGAVYKEQDTSVTGSVIGAKLSDVPGAYTLAAAADKAVAYDVNPILATGYNDFNVYVAAETGQNPTAGNDIVLTLYGKDCYENTDTKKFECGVMTNANAWTKGQISTTTAFVD